MATRYTQQAVENHYAQRNIRKILEQAVAQQLDKLLLNCSLRAYMQIPEYLKKDYYPSKNGRLAVLNAQVQQHGLDKLLVHMAAAVLHSHQPQTIQQCVGYLQGSLPHTDLFDRIKTAAELLAVCSSSTGLYSIRHKGSGYATWIIVNHWPLIDSVWLEIFLIWLAARLPSVSPTASPMPYELR